MFALLGFLTLQVATGLVADDEIATVGPLIGFIRGTGNVEASLLVGVVAQLCCRVPASFLFSRWMGFPGVGVAVLVGPLVSVSIYLWYILTRRWHRGLARVARL